MVAYRIRLSVIEKFGTFKVLWPVAPKSFLKMIYAHNNPWIFFSNWQKFHELMWTPQQETPQNDCWVTSSILPHKCILLLFCSIGLWSSAGADDNIVQVLFTAAATVGTALVGFVAFCLHSTLKTKWPCQVEWMNGGWIVSCHVFLLTLQYLF